MANSKYEYVKSFEMDDEIMIPNIIIVRVEGRNFRRFSEVHAFEKPNDMKALELMNECAKEVIKQFPEILFSYGYSDEYSFVFKSDTEFHQRRSSKILSIIVSFFTSIYVTKWEKFFPEKNLRFAPSFRSRVICCAVLEVLQAYLAWRQIECHLNNQYETCLWQLIKSGKSEKETEETLKGYEKQDRNELLYNSFNINYKKDLPPIFRQGTCTLKAEVLKYKDDGSPVKRPRKQVITVHVENIASRKFWNNQSTLKELGQFAEDMHKPKQEYLKSFQYEGRLIPSTWIVVRVDGCHFHKFTDVHEFEKPNDAQAINLMNSCAVGILEEFKDIVFAYGVSDEYSFIMKKESQLYQRHGSDIVSAVVSLFSSMYAMKWKEFFPNKQMKLQPYFDARAICYPSSEIIRDYLAWRQVDCHINNQYNTCFWMLVKSGKSKSDAQNYLKGTRTQEKNAILYQLSGVVDYYKTLPAIFCQGSSVYWEKEEKKMSNDEMVVVVKHCNIIDESFWEAHPYILNQNLNCCRIHRLQACNSFAV